VYLFLASLRSMLQVPDWYSTCVIKLVWIKTDVS